LSLYLLSATEAARRLREGECSADDYAQALLARVEEVEPQVQAWEFLDQDYLMAEAADAQLRHQRGSEQGPLSGVPVGVKDIIDVRGMPTGDGTPLHAGRMPRSDATLVRLLRRAGGIPMGKTVTTELATYAPGKTRNPHRDAAGGDHTPGGSSSGSAAAVAAGMVPLAIGTQTNGSVIRPASFCGVYGFKPTFGLIPRTGVLTQSPPLDQVGVFARSLDDIALLAQALCGDDEHDPATRSQPAPPMRRLVAAEPPLRPRLALVRTPFWDRMDADAREAFEELAGELGDAATPVELHGSVAGAVDWHRSIMEADLAASFAREFESGRDQLSPTLRAQIERGRQVSAVDYRQAVERIPGLVAYFDELFAECDAIVTPATLGTAPAGLDSTGDPLMCTLWTLAGLPALSLPLLSGANGLPLGVQLVGRKGDDARLLRTANWLVQSLHSAAT
jgi:Asp-tRNA(Asn)/Glu-tRNA(Gln) amidotransferase A subunit family amidase